MAAPTLVSTNSIESTSIAPMVTQGELMMVFFNLQNTDAATIADTLGNSWTLMQSGLYNAGAWQAFVWYATAKSTGHPTISISNAGSGGADLIVNVYSPAVIDVFSPIATGSTTAMQSAAINTNYANELIVGWGGGRSGIASANAPFTLDAETGSTLNRTESFTASSKSSFQSNFTAPSPLAWATGVLGLVNPSDIPAVSSWLSLDMNGSMRGLRK
jgi:hypothetical protein